MRDKINNEYFNWLLELICKNGFSSRISYKKLLMHLHNTEFIFSIPNDGNRADDGIYLRYRFALVYDALDRDIIRDILDGPCSVLEMMIALCLRCEEDIMDDPNVGDRTQQWFWGMIVNLGLGAMTDTNFDRADFEQKITKFLNREYEPDGKGGLFTLKYCNRDLRTVEIWHQLCWYLDSIV